MRLRLMCSWLAFWMGCGPLSLEEAAEGYRNFSDNQNEWTKVVLKP